MSSTSPYRDRSSPARQRLREERRSSGRQVDHPSPYRNNIDSPSRQLYEEFARLVVDDEKAFRERLDERDAEQEKKHREALALAAAEHERVRRNAERVRERLELEIERERKRREDEELRALEEERRLKALREQEERQRAVEQVKQQQEEERKRAQQEKELQEARAQLAEERRKNEAEAARRRAEQEEAQRKAREEAAAAEKARSEAAKQAAQAPAVNGAVTAQTDGVPAPHTTASTTIATAAAPSKPAAPPQVQPTPAVPAAVVGDKTEREALHKRYLDMHKRLKEMRQYVITECKKTPALKNQLGDWRRQIQKSMGQLRAGAERGGNNLPRREIEGVLDAAMNSPGPSIDVSSFIVSYPHNGSPLQASATFVYLLNILSKCAISQFITEASVATKAADPIGIALVSVFSQPKFKVGNGTLPLIDILLAKFHVVCPVLWGIYGNEKTPAGRERIGWWKADGVWISEQQHTARMTGLAAGYASIALRDFTKSRNDSPFPVRNYWAALARITSVPRGEVQPTHLTVLRALVDGQVPRFLGFYGQAGVMALKAALVDFPAKAPNGPAKNGVVLLPELLKRDLRLTLTG